MGPYDTRERNRSMMTTTSVFRMVVRQTLQWAAVLGTTLLVGQPAVAEDAVSVLVKRSWLT